MVTKKALMFMLSIYRTAPEKFTYNVNFDSLLASPNVGVLTATMNLLLGLASQPQNSSAYAPLYPKVHDRHVMEFFFLTRPGS